MSKLKMPVHSPRIDMTPMVDLFMLLLTFFMLTTTFKPTEPAPVDTPNSISEKLAPDKNVISLLIAKDGKVYFNIDNGADTSQHMRAKLLVQMGEYNRVTFTKEEIALFEKGAGFGVPIKMMKEWLNTKEASDKAEFETGIPMDSTDNQLQMWIHFARLTNPNAEATIKGDFDADYKVVKKVFDILQDKKVSKFNLTTTLEKVEVVAKDIQ